VFYLIHTKEVEVRVLLLVATLFTVSCAYTFPAKAEVLEIDPDRHFVIDGVIQGSSLIHMADDLMKMVNENSEDPIYLTINSPGGSVLPGIQFITAMNVAQARGVELIVR
jgi:ATP-dependent protease ClpP protease subunit